MGVKQMGVSVGDERVGRKSLGNEENTAALGVALISRPWVARRVDEFSSFGSAAASRLVGAPAEAPTTEFATNRAKPNRNEAVDAVAWSYRARHANLTLANEISTLSSRAGLDDVRVWAAARAMGLTPNALVRVLQTTLTIRQLNATGDATSAREQQSVKLLRSLADEHAESTPSATHRTSAPTTPPRVSPPRAELNSKANSLAAQIREGIAHKQHDSARQLLGQLKTLEREARALPQFMSWADSLSTLTRELGELIDHSAQADQAQSPRRSKTERLSDISQKVLEERFDGTNVNVRFMERTKRRREFPEVATPAQDSDRLTEDCPTTVGEVKGLLGGLNNSVISIRNQSSLYTDVQVESLGFRDIRLRLYTAQKGIISIEVLALHASGSRELAGTGTDNPLPDLDRRQPLVGTLLALKIFKYAELHDMNEIFGRAAFAPASSVSGEIAYQGARIWPTIGFNGRIGSTNVARVQHFINTNPDVATRVGLSVVTGNTRVLDFLADSDGNLVSESIKFWRSSPSEFLGRLDFFDKSSKSYLVYQRALADFGLK
jgi:hypothetical protein